MGDPGGVTGWTTGGVGVIGTVGTVGAVGAVGAGVVVTGGRVVVGATVGVGDATVVGDVGAGAAGARVVDGGIEVVTGGPDVAGGPPAVIVVVLGVDAAGGGVSESPGCTGTSSRHVDDVPDNGSSGRKPAATMSARCSPLHRPLEPSPAGSVGSKPIAATTARYHGERADTTVYK
jgi:hypothetical protein